MNGTGFSKFWTDLLFSFGQSMQAAQQMKIQQEYAKSQKLLIDAKLKEKAAKQAFYVANPAAKQADMLEGIPRELAMMQAQMGTLFSPLPEGQEGPLEPFQVARGEQTMPLPEGQEGPPEPIGKPPIDITEIMARAQTEPAIRGMVKKALGFDPWERKFQKGLVGEKGGRVTKEFSAMGEEIAEHPEFTTPRLTTGATPEGGKFGQFRSPDTGETRGTPFATELPGLVPVKRINEQGEEEQIWVNPRDLQEGTPTQDGKKAIITKPPERITKTFIENGITYGQRVGKVDGEPFGPRWIEKLPNVAEAGRRGMGANAAVEIENEVIPILINEDGSVNRFNIIAAWASAPWTLGRVAKQAFGRAVDLLIRSATGAALNDQETKNYDDQFFPHPADLDRGIKNKLAALKRFIDGFNQAMNPDGTYDVSKLPAHVISNLPPRIQKIIKEKAGKPSLSLGQTQPSRDDVIGQQLQQLLSE